MQKGSFPCKKGIYHAKRAFAMHKRQVVSGVTHTDTENTQYQGVVSSVQEKDFRRSMVAG